MKSSFNKYLMAGLFLTDFHRCKAQINTESVKICDLNLFESVRIINLKFYLISQTQNTQYVN
jgi:hypothetical protein